MEEENSNLERECHALAVLFQHIVEETKAGIPSFEDFVSKAGKLNSSIKGTMLALSSFLDTFQKIADAASNTKGGSRDIGTCLTRIVIRHRALESRMKTLSGALMDCLVLPIQNKLEEWRKITHALEREHAKEHKKHKVPIKKKSEQISRLRKKSKKELAGKNGASVIDPSVQRLIEQSSLDLNTQYKQLHEHEKNWLRKIIGEDRLRYCNIVASLKPIIDEELGMVSELSLVEEIMQKLGAVTANPADMTMDITDQFIDDAANGFGSGMGSRKSSMCSISSVSSSIPQSPSRSSVSSLQQSRPAELRTRQRIYVNGSDNDSRPSSALSTSSGMPQPQASQLMTQNGSSNGCWRDKDNNLRPHTISSSFEKGGLHSRPSINGHTFMPPPPSHSSTENGLPNSEPVSPAKFNDLHNNYSTIRRSYRSPFRTSVNSGFSKPPIPARCASADRSSGGSLISLQRSTSVERSFGKPPLAPNSVHVIGFTSTETNGTKPVNGNGNVGTSKNVAMVSPTHYAVPKANAKVRLVPDFHQGKHDMVIPQPVYMNSQELESLRKSKERSDSRSSEVGAEELPDDDLKTPTIEELAFPGTKALEDGSSSSSGSSSGYGSQNAVKIEEKNPGFTTSTTTPSSRIDNYCTYRHYNSPPVFSKLRPSHFTLQSPSVSLRHQHTPPIVENIISDHYCHRNRTLRRSDSYSPGMAASLLSKSTNSKGGTVFLKPAVASAASLASSPTTMASAAHNSTVCKPPPPPIRRSSSICSSSSQDRTSTFRTTNEDEDLTPHGSMENVNVLSPNQDRLSLEAMVAKASNVASNLTNFEKGNPNNSSTLRRSTSMSTNESQRAPPSAMPHISASPNFDRDQFLRRSLTLTSRSDRANLINSLTERISQRMTQHNGGAKISTHHVIPVNGAAGPSAPAMMTQGRPNKNNNKEPSPEAEIYGFGNKFKEARQQYFDMSASYPNSSSINTENQKFLDSLSSKLLN